MDVFAVKSSFSFIFGFCRPSFLAHCLLMKSLSATTVGLGHHWLPIPVPVHIFSLSLKPQTENLSSQFHNMVILSIPLSEPLPLSIPLSEFILLLISGQSQILCFCRRISSVRE